MLERGKTIVEHRVGDMQLAILILHPMQFVFRQFDMGRLVVGGLDTLAQGILDLSHHLVELGMERGSVTAAVPDFLYLRQFRLVGRSCLFHSMCQFIRCLPLTRKLRLIGCLPLTRKLRLIGCLPQEHGVDAIDFIDRIPITEHVAIIEQIICHRQL